MCSSYKTSTFQHSIVGLCIVFHSVVMTTSIYSLQKRLWSQQCDFVVCGFFQSAYVGDVRQTFGWTQSSQRTAWLQSLASDTIPSIICHGCLRYTCLSTCMCRNDRTSAVAFEFRIEDRHYLLSFPIHFEAIYSSCYALIPVIVNCDIILLSSKIMFSLLIEAEWQVEKLINTWIALRNCMQAAGFSENIPQSLLSCRHEYNRHNVGPTCSV